MADFDFSIVVEARELAGEPFHEQHRTLRALPSPKTFDVICAGEALWSLDPRGEAFSARAAPLRLRPGGGAVNAALALARRGLRVGLATALGDDALGRGLLERIAASGVDVGAVTLGPPSTGLVFVVGVGASHRVLSYREAEQPIAVPAQWSSQVLLLSGLSPVVSYGATLCKAARAARRAGSIVVVDVNARRHLWAGRDPRAIHMLLREADVVRCSADDLSVLGIDLDALRATLRPGAVLVASNGAGHAWATGPFGEVAQTPRRSVPLRAVGAGDRLTAAICGELARAGQTGEHRVELWGASSPEQERRGAHREPRPLRPMRDVLRILEAAYPTDEGDVAWLDRLSAAVRENAGIPNDGVFAQIYDASSGTTCDFGLTGRSGVGEDIVDGVFGQQVAPYYNAHPELIRAAFLSIQFSLSGEIPGIERHPHVRRLLDEAGVGEVVGLNASSPSGHGVIVCILVRRSLRLSDATRTLFGRVAGHVSAANRLRLRLRERGGPASVNTADAVLDAEGRVKHAVRGARVPEARAQLAAAAVALSRARGRPHGDHGERATASWKALIDARWSLVDHFERDGRRFLLAQRNDPEAPPLDLLTVRERQVAALAALGRANKEIAYELGIATSTVGVLLARAASRLSVRTRRELVCAFMERRAKKLNR